MRKHLLFSAIIAASCLSAPAALADATTEAQLRAALQTATAQIAQLEDQVANLQASQAPDVAMIEALRAQVQTLSKNGGGASPAAKAKSDRQTAALGRELAQLNAMLTKLQQEYAISSSTAAAKTAESVQLSRQLASLTAQLNSCNTKNAELYKIGNQILDAYAHKDDVFGTIAGREPFIGFKRVQLQNIVQNDQDSLFDNQVNPAASH